MQIYLCKVTCRGLCTFIQQVDALVLFPTLKSSFPSVCAVQKCLLCAPPSQADCEELFSLLGLYQVFHSVWSILCWCHVKTKLEYRPTVCVSTGYEGHSSRRG